MQLRKQIKGTTQDIFYAVVPNALVTLMDTKKNVLDTITSKSDGTFSFWAANESNFLLLGQKEEYKEGRNATTTFNDSLVVTANLFLTKLATKDEPLSVGTDIADIVSFKQEKIYFDFDKSNIRKDAEEELNKIIIVLNQNPNMVVELNSHTDCRSSAAYNQNLSDRRAKSSVEYIQARITNPSRISGKGYGESKLCNDCACEGDQVSPCSKADHQMNRRTEFIIVRK